MFNKLLLTITFFYKSAEVLISASAFGIAIKLS